MGQHKTGETRSRPAPADNYDEHKPYALSHFQHAHRYDSPENILYKPESAKQKTFKWISSIHWERGTIPEKDMAIVCKSKVAHEADKLFPESLLIILADAENKTLLPELCEDLKNRPAQAIIVSAPTPDNGKRGAIHKTREAD